MATVMIARRPYEVAPYKIAQMRRAAPFIDRINATAGAMGSIEGLVGAAADFCGVLAIGLMRIDPALTAEAIEEEMGIGDLPALRDGFMAVLAESGLTTAGEESAPAPETVEAAGALPTI